MGRERGELVYKIYRALTYALSPMVNLHLRWRKFRGLEHPKRWPERLGRPSLPRPVGPLVWFHAVSLGEGMAAIPVVKCCVTRRPDVTVLMTSTTMSAFEVVKSRLPSNVIFQFAPLDTPVAVEAFLGYWKPNALILLESELWPNLIIDAAKNVMLRVHRRLKEVYPDIVTIIVPRHPQHAQKIAMELQKKGINVAVRSRRDILSLKTEIYVVDTLGELREVYRLTPIAVIGGSFLPGLAGHNISEAAIAGCAILTGNYVGHFNHMVQDMQLMNHSSVLQVSEDMLGEALIELFTDAKILEARRAAAKQAYHTLSRGIIEKIWSLLQFHIFFKVY